MGRAKTEKSNALVRRYLLRDLARAGFSGLQYSVILYLIDQTYGWKRPGQPDGRVRKDRAEIDYQLLTEATGGAYRSVLRAVRGLIRDRVLTSYQEATKTAPAILGINSETSEWACFQDEDRDPNSASNGSVSIPDGGSNGSLNEPNGSLSGQNGSLSGTELFTKDRATIDATRASSPPNKNINKDLNRIFNKSGGGSIFDPMPEDRIKIRDPQEAARTTLTIQEAAGQAEGAYLEAFSMPLSAVERVDLINWIKLGSTPQGMLAAWLMAITSAQKERHEKRADPKQRQFVSRRPFKDVMRHGAEVYESIKARRSLGSVPREPNLN